MSFHPHLHCLVSGGGLATDGTWKPTREDYLFPHLVLSRLFRGKFLAGLVRLYERGALDLGGECAPLAEPDAFQALKDRLYGKDWVVYAKPPFAGPEQVYRYLGRYTHRIAVSNGRLEAFDDSGVRFRTKHGKTVTLRPLEFIRRFLLHVLPEGFHKIRHYGFARRGQDRRRARARPARPPRDDGSSSPARADTGGRVARPRAPDERNPNDPLPPVCGGCHGPSPSPSPRSRGPHGCRHSFAVATASTRLMSPHDSTRPAVLHPTCGCTAPIRADSPATCGPPTRRHRASHGLTLTRPWSFDSSPSSRLSLPPLAPAICP